MLGGGIVAMFQLVGLNKLIGLLPLAYGAYMMTMTTTTSTAMIMIMMMMMMTMAMVIKMTLLFICLFSIFDNHDGYFMTIINFF